MVLVQMLAGFQRGVAMGAVAMLIGVGVSARGQDASPVYPDDSPAAVATLLGVDQLVDSGNEDEALRALQRLLEEEGDRVFVSPDDEDLYLNVRTGVHRALLDRPELLSRYMSSRGAAALALLEGGEVERVERNFLLTSAGLEAALRLTQSRMEAARFNAARRTLWQVVDHPAFTRGGAGAGDALELAELLARYLPDERSRALVDALSISAAREGDIGDPIDHPPLAKLRSHSPMDSGAELGTEAVPSDPMWTVALEGDETTGDPENRYTNFVSAPANWTYPTIVGDVLLVSDSVWIRAWDRYTLDPLWRTRPSAPTGAPVVGDAWANRQAQIVRRQGVEDTSSISYWGGMVTTVTGVARDGVRYGDPRVHGIELSTGRVLWSVAPDALDDRLVDGSVRGPVLVDEGVVVATVRKSARTRRVVSTYLVGLDARTGEELWVRLLASAGSLPFRSDRRVAHAGAVAGGIVYAADQLGVVGAFELETGRPLWVRRLGSTPLTRGGRGGAWQANTPVVIGDSVFMLSEARESILRIDRTTGELLAERDAARFGAPDYLIGAGDHLGAVNQTRILLVRADQFDEGEVGSTPRITGVGEGGAGGGGSAGIIGRVFWTGSEVAAPTMDGVRLFDPAHPDGSERKISLVHSGNMVTAGEQIVVVDDEAVHSYVGWSVAERVLSERMESAPDLASPAVSYADLAFRVGRQDRILPAVDRALAAIRRRPFESSNQMARERLFESLLTMVRADGREAGGPKPLGLALANDVVVRLGRAAETRVERVEHLLALEEVRLRSGEPALGGEALRRILSDSALAATPRTVEGRGTTAGVVATRRMRRILLDSGLEPLRVGDAEATALLREIGAEADHEELERFARAHPLTRGSVEAWLRAAEAHGTVRPGARLDALREALLTSELLASAGMEPDLARLAEVVGRLVQAHRDLGQHAQGAQALSRIMRSHPLLTPTLRGQTLDPVGLLTELRALSASTDRRVHISAGLSGRVQPLPGWRLELPMYADAFDVPAGHIVMRSVSARELALFGPDEADPDLRRRALSLEPAGSLSKLWTRTFEDIRPRLITTTPDRVYLLHSVAGEGATIECIDALNGRTLWETPPFNTAMAQEQRRLTTDIGQAIIFATPSGSRRALSELRVVLGRHSIALVELSGRTAIFDLATGEIRRALGSDVRTVFGVHGAGGMLAICGSAQAPDVGGRVPPEPRVQLFDMGTGREIDPGAELERFVNDGRREPAWVRVSDDQKLLIGFDGELLAYDVAGQRTLWEHSGARDDMPQGAWIIGETAFVKSLSGAIRAHPLREGAGAGEEMRAGGRLARDFVQVDRVGEGFVFRSDGGVVVADQGGRVIAMDALDATGPSAMTRPGLSERYVVAAERTSIDTSDGMMRYAVRFISPSSGALLASSDILLPTAESPDGLALIDNRVIISTRLGSVVYGTGDGTAP